MRFAVETWAPDYGRPFADDDLLAGEGRLAAPEVDVEVEVPAAAWRPLDPPVPPTGSRPGLLFVDGVRRIDARVWIDPAQPGEVAADGPVRPGICASYAAGAVALDGTTARVADVVVERSVFTACPSAGAITTAHGTYGVRLGPDDGADALSLALQDRMGRLEGEVAARSSAEVVVVDGPLRAAHPTAIGVGYVKTHRLVYVPDPLLAVVHRLEPGQRSPLFMVGGRFARLSWYLRLPGRRSHPMGGVVRCELAGDTDVAEAAGRADRLGGLLPRLASQAHKDPRAPQNLYPIAGLERELRRRLGDQRLLELALRRAASR